MKMLKLLLCAAMLFLGSCIRWPEEHLDTSKHPRVGQETSREDVASYEVYKIAIKGHRMAMLKLKSGDVFPVVCRVEEDSIRRIPQTTWAQTDQPNPRWRIMCEPQTEFTYSLMSIQFEIRDGVVRSETKKLRKLDYAPPLVF